MHIRILTVRDASVFRALRLRGLLEDPTAFASSYEEESAAAPERVAERLAADDGAVFGAFDGERLLGVVGVRREAARKLAHRAELWGMYVAPEARGGGLARQLVIHALDHAERVLGVRQVHLGVNTASNEALGLYRGLGFEIHGTEPGYLCVDGVLHDDYRMVRRLDASAPPNATIPFVVGRIDHVVLRVPDLERSIAFYTSVIGCTVARRRDELGLVHLRAGASLIDLVDVAGPLGRQGGAAAGAGARNLDHLCLRVDPFVEEEILAHLAAHGLRARGPAMRNFGAEGHGWSLYLEDPDGNVIELKGPSSRG